MSERYGCEQVTSLAPELALGTAVGEERAKALEHLATCATCRRLVNELSSLTDEIIGVAPAMEPPAGFEGRVLERLVERRHKDRRWSWVGIAAVLGALATTVLLLVVFDDERDIADQYRSTLAVADGRYFGAVPLEAEGLQEGYVFVYHGEPSWIFMTLDDSTPGPHVVELQMSNDDRVDLGSFELEEGKRHWGTIVDHDLGEAEMLLVTDLSGGEVLNADLAHH